MKLLKKHLKEFKKSEGGNVLIIVAFSMVALLGMAALAVDGGSLYQTRRNMVNAADAAALAGAQEFMYAENSSDVESFAETFAQSNYDLSNATATVNVEAMYKGSPVSEYTIKVETEKIVDFGFARILGFESSVVTAEATALIGVLIEGDLIPIHMQETMFNTLSAEGADPNHNIVEFHQDQEPEKPGNWGWVYFEKNENARDTIDFLDSGYPHPLPIGYGAEGSDTYKEFASNTGDNIFNVDKARVNSILQGYVDNHTKLLVPVSEYVDKFTGKEPLEIIGFAVIQLTGFDMDESRISGYLLENQLFEGDLIPGLGDSGFDPKSVTLVD